MFFVVHLSRVYLELCPYQLLRLHCPFIASSAQSGEYYLILAAGQLLNIPGTATRNTAAQPPDYPCAMESGLHLCYRIRNTSSYFISSSSSVLLSLLLDLLPFRPSTLLSHHKIPFRPSRHKNSVLTLQRRKSTPNILMSD
jgi:hypothetical protein